MIIVTGGAGFIGSNLIKRLNYFGIDEIIIVDDLKDGRKCLNLHDLKFSDFIDIESFYNDPVRLAHTVNKADCVFHQGANSSTTDWDGKQMMRLNYEYSKHLYHACIAHSIPFIYASSASVYGTSKDFSVNACNEKPLNMYAFSKWAFDQYLRRQPTPSSQVVGFRYFNVYGPRESHKDDMASPFTKFTKELADSGEIKLFEGSEEIKRDFIHVDDAVEVVIWALHSQLASGLYNLGTGEVASFYDVARTVGDSIRFIPFPEHLKNAYQHYTRADIQSLRHAGCTHQFRLIETFCLQNV